MAVRTYFAACERLFPARWVQLRWGSSTLVMGGIMVEGGGKGEDSCTQDSSGRWTK